jgi:hypothetical protein
MTTKEKERNKDYVLQMRKLFSNKNSILQDGELNHKYFQTKIGQFWTEEDTEKLIKGIEEFGVGAWNDIKQKYLKTWVIYILCNNFYYFRVKPI